MCSGSLNNQDTEKNLIKPAATQSFASVILMQKCSPSLYFNCQFQILWTFKYLSTIKCGNSFYFYRIIFFFRHFKLYSVRSHCIHTIRHINVPPFNILQRFKSESALCIKLLSLKRKSRLRIIETSLFKHETLAYFSNISPLVGLFTLVWMKMQINSLPLVAAFGAVK